MISAKAEALDFIRQQSEVIAKDLTREHRKFVASFNYMKESTEESLKRLAMLEKERIEDRKRAAIDSSTMEAMYAIEFTNPLSLYD